MDSKQRRSVLIGVGVAVAAVVLVVAGLFVLGGDDGGKEARQQTRARAVSELEAKLLQQVDLPGGYSTAQAVVGGQDTDKCGASVRTERDGRVATARAGFQSGAGVRLEEVISRYQPDKVAGVMASARSLANDCASFSQRPVGGGPDVAFRTTSRQFPTLLEETIALRVEGSNGVENYVFDQIFMRQGNEVVVIVHGGTAAVEPSVTEQIARKAAEKAAKPA